jgi:UDP-N-acetylglucosamine 2-epimerase
MAGVRCMTARHLTLVAAGRESAATLASGERAAVLVHVVGDIAQAARAVGMALAVSDTGAFTQRLLDASPDAASGAVADLGAPAEVRRVELPEASPAQRLAVLLEAVAAELDDAAPAAVVIHGDCDAALAGALGAARRRLPLVRVGGAQPEARTPALLRRLADVLLVHDEYDAMALVARGLHRERIWVVGDPLTELLRRARGDPAVRAIGRRTAVAPNRCLVAVLSDPTTPPELAYALADRRPLIVELSRDLAAAWRRAGVLERLLAATTAPLAALSLAERLALMWSADALITDSPLLRDAAAILGVPAAADPAALPPGPRRLPSVPASGTRCAEALVANLVRMQAMA